MPEEKQIQPILFLIETSGGIKGPQHYMIDNVMKNLLAKLKKANEVFVEQNKAFMVAALTFSTGCKWLTKGLIAAEDFQWEMPDCGGAADLGAACAALSRKMSREGLFAKQNITARPIVILFSCYKPTDDYKKELDILWENRWFHYAEKIAVALGGDADEERLIEFAGRFAGKLVNLGKRHEDKEPELDGKEFEDDAHIIMKQINDGNFGTPFALADDFMPYPPAGYKGYGFVKSFSEQNGSFFVEETHYDG